ncbi:MAG: hypothetical protein Q8903_04215 [Bacteroidota bacterium]|nr:hypothetical protein [Bacteroidota bacterium]
MKLLLQFLIILISLSFPLAAQKQLEMETVIQKDTFLVGEEVNFGFGLKNITNSNQQINDGTIDIKILDTACNILQKTGLGTLYDFTPMAKLLLDEGETYQVYDLTEMFGNQKYHGFYKYYFKAGNYQIKIKLTNPNNYIEEKNIKINVVEPQGDESIFFNTFKNILLPIYTLNYNNKLFTEQLENLHATYPNCVYSPSLLDFLSFMLKFGGDSPQYEKDYNFIIELI